MRLMIREPAFAVVLASAALTAGCGSSQSTSSAGGPAGALAADARSAATGDIPDNQAFLAFADHAAGYSMKYPEGWTQSASSSGVSFRDKNNLVHIVIARGAAPTTGSIVAQLKAEKQAQPTLSFRAPQVVKLHGGTAVKAVYTTQSPPNAVTGKRVTLIVDRYELAHGGRVATVDLGTPVGVDNVDAYRMMIESFRWR
jgi:hypothetical protein